MGRWLKILILQAQQANPDQPITIATLAKLFRDRNGISANQAIKANASKQTFKQFLAAHATFELSSLPDGQQIQVTLAKAATGQANGTKPAAATVSGQQAASVQPIQTAQALEQASGKEKTASPCAAALRIRVILGVLGKVASAVGLRICRVLHLKLLRSGCTNAWPLFSLGFLGMNGICRQIHVAEYRSPGHSIKRKGERCCALGVRRELSPSLG